MPDRRRHRGPHPADAALFADDALPGLRTAVDELSWLLARGYRMNSALALVGNRHGLRERQRLAVQRAACTDGERDARAARRLTTAELAGRALAVDGFNVVIAIEAALSGGVLVIGRDRVLRDLSSVHGSYRRVEETERAVDLVAATLADAGVAHAQVWLDRPVSNSGRLAAMIRERAGAEVELVDDPDRRLIAAADRVVCTGDAVILDHCGAWLDLPAAVIDHHHIEPWRIDLGQ